MSLCSSSGAVFPSTKSCWLWSHGLGGVLLLLALMTGGCASSEDATEANDTPPVPREVVTTPDSTVRTVQLYRGDDERALPVLFMDEDTPLTLEFDLLVDDGRPLSIYFIHADQTWRRDLSPSQYMRSFSSASLLDYRPSRSTDVRYMHYTYQFPNNDIEFTVSGNYILRVTEQGRRDEVLFERPFYVSEQQAEGNLELETLRRRGAARPPLRPTLLFTPPEELRGNPYGYTVCFARHAVHEAPRCSTRPLLSEQPALAFELDRADAFEPLSPALLLDLTNLRTNTNIIEVDRTQRPPRVVLEPDRARLLDNEGTRLGGQSIIRAALRTLPDGELSGEYVDVQFSFVPPEQTSDPGDVRLNGPIDPSGMAMQWDEQAQRYTATLRLKQGKHAYRYRTTDDTIQAAMQNAPRLYAERYLTFVYYRDARVGTDRLLQVQTARPPR